ncbi:MAG: methionyl-tRNA formyltransferase [Patescibacteria group bacterium]
MSNEKIKIGFFGTPEFAEIILKRLFEEDAFEIAVVVCAPDKPVGRKQVLTAPSVKVLVKENNIQVLQPEKLDDIFIQKLEEFNLDLNVVAAYGKIMPLKVLDIPKHKSINVHPSLLPKYRGPSPIQAAILNGDKETGITIILMDEKMDHGPILSQERYILKDNLTIGDIHDELADLSGKILVDTIYKYISKKIQPQEQDHDEATFCKMIEKEHAKIDWDKPASDIYNQWRAFTPWPGLFMDYKGNILKFIQIELTKIKDNINHGEFIVKDKKLYISCKDNILLEIKKLQPQGKKVMDADSFINGHLN